MTKSTENVRLKNRKALWVVLALIPLIGILVILLITEALLNTSKKSFEIAAEGDPRVVILREYPPNLELSITRRKGDTATIDERGQHTQAVIRTNDEGFIQPSGTHKEADKTLVFLGGSTTECLWMREEQRFPYLVSKVLEERTAFSVNSYNGALGGNDMRHSINILWNKALALSPDYVFLMHNINDMTLLQRRPSYWENKERPYLANVDEIDRQVPYANLRAMFGGWFPNIRALFKKVFSPTNQDEWHEVRGKAVLQDTTRILKEYEQALRSFISICQSWNITPVLMTQANLITGIDMGTVDLNADFEASLKRKGSSYQEYQLLYTQMNQVNRKLSTIYKIPLIDLDQKVPKEKTYFYDKVHFTYKGSKKAAEIIAEAMTELLDTLSESDSKVVLE